MGCAEASARHSVEVATTRSTSCYLRATYMRCRQDPIKSEWKGDGTSQCPLCAGYLVYLGPPVETVGSGRQRGIHEVLMVVQRPRYRRYTKATAWWWYIVL